jgi:hypothetical protein
VQKTLDFSAVGSIIRTKFLPGIPVEQQEVIMTSKANYLISADLVNIHIPVT